MTHQIIKKNKMDYIIANTMDDIENVDVKEGKYTFVVIIPQGYGKVKATMTDIRVIIREFSRGTSLREMERKLKLSRTSLRTYRNRSESSGLSMIDLLKLNNAKCRQVC